MNGAADLILVIAGLGAVFLGLLLLIGALTAYLTRHVEDIPADPDPDPDPRPTVESWFHKGD